MRPAGGYAGQSKAAAEGPRPHRGGIALGTSDHLKTSGKTLPTRNAEDVQDRRAAPEPTRAETPHHAPSRRVFANPCYAKNEIQWRRS